MIRILSCVAAALAYSPLVAQTPLPANPADLPARPTITISPHPGTTVRAPVPASSDSVLAADTPPRFRAVKAWYYPPGRRGERATVEFEAVVDEDGRVEPTSIRLLAASDSAFILPARYTLLCMVYTPGRAGRRKVPTQVHQTVRYNSRSPRGTELPAETPGNAPTC